MARADRAELIQKLAPPLDELLTTQLVAEFVDVERRYVQGDWGPTELDGGRFGEALARILYHQDSGNLGRNREFSECLEYLENNAVPHRLAPRSDPLMICRVLRSVFKFRSGRGVAHLSPTYSANQMDARLVVETVRWSMTETLRIFGVGNREEVARIVRELLRFDVPCIGRFGTEVLVQRTDLNPEEEILLLLHEAGERGLSRTELGQQAKLKAPTVTRTLQRLADPTLRQIVDLKGKHYCISDLGTKRVREEMAGKLLAG
jgi:hypothetical protein